MLNIKAGEAVDKKRIGLNDAEGKPIIVGEHCKYKKDGKWVVYEVLERLPGREISLWSTEDSLKYTAGYLDIYMIKSHAELRDMADKLNPRKRWYEPEAKKKTNKFRVRLDLVSKEDIEFDVRTKQFYTEVKLRAGRIQEVYLCQNATEDASQKLEQEIYTLQPLKRDAARFETERDALEAVKNIEKYLLLGGITKADSYVEQIGYERG